MERSFRFLDIDSSYGSDLEIADGEHEEDRCCGCVRYWSIVSHEENQSRGIYEFRGQCTDCKQRLCRQCRAPGLHYRLALHLRRDILDHQSRAMEVSVSVPLPNPIRF